MRTRLASEGSVRRDQLLKVGYGVALLLVLIPVVDALTRTWPIRRHDVQWRLGTLGMVFNAMVTPLLGTFLAMVIAATLEHARTLRIMAVITLLAALGSAVSVVAFGLDYMQLRANVTAEAMGVFDAASRKAIIVAVLGLVVTAWLGIAGWKTAGSLLGSRRSPDKVGLVINKGERS